MAALQDQYDDAMFDFSRGDYPAAVTKLEAILASDPAHFDAQLALGMAYSRCGEVARAITEGHKAEQLRPTEQLAHTNLSLFYLKAGDKARAEHHGLQARIASWRGNMAPPGSRSPSDAELAAAKPAAPNVPEQFPEMPWKKRQYPDPAQAPAAPASTPSNESSVGSS